MEGELQWETTLVSLGSALRAFAIIMGPVTLPVVSEREILK